MKPIATETISEIILRRMTTWNANITTDPLKIKEAIDGLSEHLISYFAIHYAQTIKPSSLPGLPGSDA